MGHLLTSKQIYQFLDDGYLLASGLIPFDISARADAAAFRCNGIDPGDPSSWKNAPQNEFFDDPDLMACYTDELLCAAAQLSHDPTQYQRMRVPPNAFVIKLLPTNEEWKVVGMHLDGGYENPPLLFTPPQWQMFAMIYLHDIEPHGGGTVLWPRTHRKLQALARSCPNKYRFLRDLAKDLHLIETGEPVELAPRAGDVLFMHPMMLHTKPMNTGSRPRFALHVKW